MLICLIQISNIPRTIKASFIITVNNIDQCLKSIPHCGGKILEDINLVGESRRTIVEDPEGRLIRILEKS